MDQIGLDQIVLVITNKSLGVGLVKSFKKYKQSDSGNFLGRSKSLGPTSKVVSLASLKQNEGEGNGSPVDVTGDGSLTGSCEEHEGVGRISSDGGSEGTYRCG